MKRVTKYRIFLYTLLTAGILLLFGFTFQFEQEQIPDKMRVQNLENLNLDLGWIVTRDVYPEMENVSINSFSSQEFQIRCRLFGLIPLKTIDVQLAEPSSVYIGGSPVGIYLETKGVMVISSGIVEGQDGLNYEPARNLVQPGDYILAVNHTEIADKNELIEKIDHDGEEALILTLRRKEEIINVRLETVRAADGSYKAGIWVRDNTQGIGTLTFVTQNGMFGALGHGINDVDTGFLMETEGGTLYETTILNIKKGERGNPGELSGTISYQKDRVYGTIQKNEQVGIFGTGENKLLAQTGKTLMETAFKQDVHEGKAYIRSSIGGTMTDYEVEIIEVHYGEKDVNKGIVLKVVDKRLLALTGGIVQGMSGSPILQDGKLIGSVTHVFVQDSTKGFGIFIENMLEYVE